MQQDSEKVQERIIIATAVLLLAAITVFVLFNNSVTKLLHDTTRSTLDEVGTQQQIIINTEMHDAKRTVVGLAESLSSLGLEKSTLKQYLVKQIENYTFEELAFYGVDGFVTSAYGRIEDINTVLHYKNPMRIQATMSEPYLCLYSNSKVIDIAAPVFNDDELIGLLVVKYSFVHVTFNLTNTLQGIGYALISEGNGNPILSTTENYHTLQSLDNTQLLNGETLENVRQNLTMKRSGNFSFKINNKNQIAIYKPLNINDWFFVLVVDEELATASTKVFANTIAFSGMAVLGLLTFFLWYTLNSKAENIKNIEKVAYYDELTGLPNLTKFRLHVLETLQQHPDKYFAMIKIDIVNFKAINEMFNFETGNNVLRAFAKTGELATEETFILARITADEFIMFAGNDFLENLDDMTYFYEEYFKNTIPELNNYHLQFVYGRYFIKPCETDINDMINKTTMAHAIAKTKKGNTIWNYDNSYKEQILQIADITNKMRKALHDKEFIPFLQPKYNVVTKKVVGAEALIRWYNQEGTLMLPNVFVPLFEKNGFIVELDMYVLKCVCKTIKGWIEKGYECVPISVNVSRAHLENKDFLQQIVTIVDGIGIPHNYIELELTESIVLENEEVLENLLFSLHKEGFLVSIDDFGSGYSSLGLLKNFKVNTIKLDRSFFNKTKEKGRGELVVDGIVKLANSLNIHVVAEGIETEEQVSLLHRVSCETIQGFYFDKAQRIEEFTEKYIGNISKN